jgi:hypothetical protein
MCGSYLSRPINTDTFDNNSLQEYKTQPSKQSKIKIDEFYDISIKEIKEAQEYITVIYDTFDIDIKSRIKSVDIVNDIKKSYMNLFFIDDYHFNRTKIKKFIEIHGIIKSEKIVRIAQLLFNKYENMFLHGWSRREPLDLMPYDIKKSGLDFILDELYSRTSLKDTLMIFIYITILYDDRRMYLIKKIVPL